MEVKIDQPMMLPSERKIVVYVTIWNGANTWNSMTYLWMYYYWCYDSNSWLQYDNMIDNKTLCPVSRLKFLVLTGHDFTQTRHKLRAKAELDCRTKELEIVRSREVARLLIHNQKVGGSHSG